MNQEIYSLKLERSNSEKAYTDTHEPLFLMPIASSNNVNLNISSSISESEDESYMSFIKQTPRHSVGDLKFTKNNKKTPQLPVFRNSESVDPCKLSINDMDEPKRLHKITESKTKRKSYLNQQKQYTRNQRYGTYTNHGFGVAFSYWKPFTTHPLCKPKYANLRDELLANRIYTISIEEYIKIWKRGKKLINQVQTILGNNGDANTASARKIAPWNDYCNIKPDDKISLDHLLSILFYCNADALQNIFSSTFRRLIKVNENDYEFKNRHKYFYYFAKNLREVCEVYGNVLVDDDLVLYHGIDHPLYFTKMVAKFFGPTSTTKSIIIAQQFSGDNGIILQIGNYIRNVFYFDCFLSGYDREREYLFIGGNAALKIKNILNVNSNTGEIENYSKYLRLIQIFLLLLSNQNIDEEIPIYDDDVENKHEDVDMAAIISYRLNKNSNISIPSYVSNLFDMRCNKLTEISVDITQLKKISNQLNISDYVLGLNNNMTNLNFFAKLCPNISKISCVFENDFRFNEEIKDY
eukprot:241311_1